MQGIHIWFFLLLSCSSFFTIHETIVNDSFTKVNECIFSIKVSQIPFMKKDFKRASILFKL